MWFCEAPLGDAPIEADVVENRLNQEITAYLEWMSEGRYRPMFQVADRGRRRQPAGLLVRRWAALEPELPVLLVDRSPANDRYPASRKLVEGGTNVTRPQAPQPRPGSRRGTAGQSV